jgi:hypothetical protein
MDKKFRLVINAVLAATLTITGTMVGAAPAFADKYDGPNAPVISLDQAPTKTINGDPGIASPPSNCNQPFPANPVVECGFATFGNQIGITQSAWGDRVATGLPASRWSNDFGMQFLFNWNSIKGNYIHLHKKARDFAVGAAPVSLKGPFNSSFGDELAYYSSGVHWKDAKSWSQKTTITSKSVTVRVAQPTIIPAREVIISKKPLRTRLIPQQVIPPTPVSVDTLIIKDEIFDRSGNFNTRTYRSPGTYTVTVYTHLYTPQWLARSVTLGGVSYYPTPSTKQVWCQTELGPGSMEGPFDHDGTPLNSKIGVADSDLDAQTILRKWWTKPPASQSARTKDAPGGGFILMSNIGERVQNAPSIFQRGNTQALALVNNCIQDKPSYVASATNQPCIVLEPTSPLYGKQLPASNELCQTFVPGNYNKNLTNSLEMLCTIVTRDWIGFSVATAPLLGGGSAALLGRPTTASERVTFVHCSQPVLAKNNPDRPKSPNAIGYPVTKAFFACSGDTPSQGNKMWHPDRNYNFLTCGYTFVCEVPGGNKTPTITDVNSNTSTRGTSQILASGAQSKVNWAKPTGIGVIDNSGRRIATIAPDETKAWQSWTVLPGSIPWNFGKSANDDTQPVFGSNTLNSSPNGNNSVLNSGVNGWANPDMFLRGYKGTNVATSNMRIGDLLVRTGELIPFALYTEYNATTPRNTTVFGKPVTMNMPVTCEMPPAYLYFLSGRATG